MRAGGFEGDVDGIVPDQPPVLVMASSSYL